MAYRKMGGVEMAERLATSALRRWLGNE